MLYQGNITGTLEVQSGIRPSCILLLIPICYRWCCFCCLAWRTWMVSVNICCRLRCSRTTDISTPTLSWGRFALFVLLYRSSTWKVIITVTQRIKSSLVRHHLERRSMMHRLDAKTRSLKLEVTMHKQPLETGDITGCAMRSNRISKSIEEEECRLLGKTWRELKHI